MRLTHDNRTARRLKNSKSNSYYLYCTNKRALGVEHAEDSFKGRLRLLPYSLDT